VNSARQQLHKEFRPAKEESLKAPSLLVVLTNFSLSYVLPESGVHTSCSLSNALILIL